MFIAMNRFRVIKGNEPAFEELWLSRETFLDQSPGFV
jgi:heme-degrading monooxygenase HmoA